MLIKGRLMNVKTEHNYSEQLLMHFKNMNANNNH